MITDHALHLKHELDNLTSGEIIAVGWMQGELIGCWVVYLRRKLPKNIREILIKQWHGARVDYHVMGEIKLLV